MLFDNGQKVMAGGFDWCARITVNASSGVAEPFCHSKVEHGVGAIGPVSVHRQTRTLLVGTGFIAAQIADELKADDERLLVGFIDSGYHVESAREVLGVVSLGAADQLGAVIVEHCIDEIQLAFSLENGMPKFRQIYEIAGALGIPLALRMELPEGLSRSRLDVDSPFASLLLNQHLSDRWPCKFWKRSLDLIVSLSILVLLLPLFAVIAIAVKLTSPGPVFFKQPRVGLRRREFKMWKFRSMVKNAEQLRKEVASLNNAKGASFKIVRDPRLTPIGEFLRRTSLDELPQFVNVLLGEMSLTGPRPIPLWVADQLQDTTYYRRFHVMPGLTGWWQIKGREQDFEVMARQDLYYVDNWSLALDLHILLGTLPAVVKGYGAH